MIFFIFTLCTIIYSSISKIAYSFAYVVFARDMKLRFPLKSASRSTVDACAEAVVELYSVPVSVRE